jgi:glutathione S-transferase
MSLRLYDYGPSPNCHKVRILLSQLGREYERVPVDIFAGETLTPEFMEKNPGLTTPVLEVEPGTYLPESNAILLHLAEGTEFLPEDPLERAEVYRWLMWEQARMFGIVATIRFLLTTGRIDPDSDVARQQVRFATAVVAGVDAHLATHEFMAAGRYTIADMAIYGYMQVADQAGVDMAPFANVAAWLERIRSQPGHVDDLDPMPENSQKGKSKSVYDLLAVEPS